MFDEEDIPKIDTLPRNIESMSVEELEKYISDLQNEIKRVEADIVKKKAHKDAAASVFKN